MLISPYFQTRITQFISSKLSKALNAKVDVNGVDIDFFKTIVLEGIIVEDQKQDTLLYAKELKADVIQFLYSKQKIDFKNIELINSTIKIIKRKGKTKFNYDFIADYLGLYDTTKTSSKWLVNLNSIEIKDTRFVYKNENDTSTCKGIAYNNIAVSGINAEINEIKFNDDSTCFRLEKLSAKEKSGFVLDNLSSNVLLSQNKINLNNTTIKTPQSDIEVNLAFKYFSWDDWKDFINQVKMKAMFKSSKVEMADVAYFSDALNGINYKINVEGNISGTVSDLKGKDVSLEIGNNTKYIGDFALNGLPDIDQTFIHLDIDKLQSNKTDIENIPLPPFTETNRIKLPRNIALLGNPNFKGKFTGLLNDFVAYGTFSTALGKITTDISFNQMEGKVANYSGNIKASNFNIGKYLYLGNQLQYISADLTITGSGFHRDNASLKLEGNITNFDYNSHSYKNILVEGKLAKKIFDGKLNVNDEALKMDFAGKINFNVAKPLLDFNADVAYANLIKLNFVSTKDSSAISFKSVVALEGIEIDNTSGQIELTDVKYQKGEKLYELPKIVFNSDVSSKNRKINVSSDALDASISGDFKILELPQAFQYLFSNYLPHYILSKSDRINSEFDFSINLKKINSITGLVSPDLKISNNSVFSGNFNLYKNQFLLNGKIDSISYSGVKFYNFSLNGNSSDAFSANTTFSKIELTDSIWIEKFSAIVNLKRDTMFTTVEWDNQISNNNNAKINSILSFQNYPELKLNILPSYIKTIDTTWVVNNANYIMIDSLGATFNDVVFKAGIQQLGITGKASKSEEDILKLELKNFTLKNLNAYTKPNGVELDGILTGTTSLSGVFKSVLFTSSNDIKEFKINKELIGDGSIESIWDRKKQAVYTHGTLSKGIVPNVLFSGFYYPYRDTSSLDFEANLQAIKMQTFEPYVKEYCSEFLGNISGQMFIYGTPKKPLIKGKLNVQAKKIKVNYLNTTYSFSDDIEIDNNYFSVEDIEVTDQYMNKAYVRGKLYHDNFKNFQLDFDILTKKFLVLNTNETLNNLFYGKAFVSGTVNFFGYLDKVYIDANVKTERVNVSNKTELTKIFIPLSATEEVADNNFITFIKKDTLTKSKTTDDYRVNLNGMEIDLNVELTPDAEIQLIFDQKVGDIIKSRGSGNLRLFVNTNGKFNMYGNYFIEDGDYLFTLQNIINKKFRLDNGGTIKWSGDPYNADIDIGATYTLRTSLKPFFPFDSSGVYKKRYSVDCKLHLTDNLMSPNIAFDIDMPTVDDNTKQIVKTSINTEQEMNKQVFSLLVLNSFVTPSQYSNLGYSTDSRSNAGAANSSEMLSNQLSNMLSKISNDFDVGVNYRPGDEITNKELEVALSTQLFDDKVSIDGNLGVSSTNTNTQQSTNNIVGDVNVEYKLTDDGRFRVRAFNKSNENNLINNQGQYTQGIGIFYREEFNTLGDLFRKYLSKKKK